MSDAAHPLIIFIPGLLPKPEPEIHRAALLRCLLAGVRRIDEDVATTIESTTGAFDIVSWTYDFYRAHRDIALDIAESTSWRRQMLRWVYALGDMMPFLIPHIASERMEVHLRDLHRYVRDVNGIATHTRRMLKIALLAATKARHPVLLAAHSMGSVIAYDSLWELSHSGRDRVPVDMLLTMGSPLGQRYMQKRIKGAGEKGYERYPNNIRRWKNLAAVGDMTAFDPVLADDFEEMLELGLLESLEDRSVLTHFRLNGELNVHAEYGYLVSDETARTIVKWWREHDASLRA
jgi:hypothetical protein